MEPTTAWEHGLSFAEADKRMSFFGLNGLIIPEKSTVRILLDEVIHPFMLFQLLSIALWFTDEYYYYASCILIITVFSVLDTLLETKKVNSHDPYLINSSFTNNIY